MLKTIWLVVTLAMAQDGSGIIDSDAVATMKSINSPSDCKEAAEKIASEWWAPRNGKMISFECTNMEVEIPNTAQIGSNVLSELVDPHSNLPPDVLEAIKKQLRESNSKDRGGI